MDVGKEKWARWTVDSTTVGVEMIGNGFGDQEMDDEVMTQFCSLGRSLPGWRMGVLDSHPFVIPQEE